MPNVLVEIRDERHRQIVEERFDSHPDDQHKDGELAKAAACYACPHLAAQLWPWSPHWWKPKDQRSNLIRAAALIMAEIERMDRMQP